MYLEKMIEVKTFVTPQGYDDEVNIKGFNNRDNIQSRNITNLKELNRMILRNYGVQEVTAIMRYQENGMKKLMISFYDENFITQNSR